MQSVKSRGRSATLKHFQCEKKEASEPTVVVDSVLLEYRRREKLLLLIQDAERRVADQRAKMKAEAARVISSMEGLLNLEMMRCPKRILDMNFNYYLERLDSGDDTLAFDHAALEAQCKFVISDTPRRKKVKSRKEPFVVDENTKVSSTPPVRRSTRQSARAQQVLSDRQNTDLLPVAAPRKCSQTKYKSAKSLQKGSKLEMFK